MRGNKLGLLTSTDYNNLYQCESLEDIKLYLVRSGDAAFGRDGRRCRGGAYGEDSKR